MADWKRVSRRMGFWIDMEDAYWTMDASYVQSVWWAVKRLHELDLLYQDFRVTAYCPRCGTGLSDAEVALGYTTVEDPSVYVEFPVEDGPRSGPRSLVGRMDHHALDAGLQPRAGGRSGRALRARGEPSGTT